MKVFRILSHPYTLIICFLMILISGEQWSGFYVFYLLLALPYGGVHALLALGGIFVVLVSHHWIKDQNTLKQVLSIVGVLFLFTSLYYFFINDRLHYNWGTFREFVPMFTILLAVFTSVCFLLGTFLATTQKKIKII